MSGLAEFNRRLRHEWLEPFCRHPARQYPEQGYVESSASKLDPLDAKDFLCAVDEGLVEHRNGVFTAPCSKVKEQIFWSGSKSVSPRPITLWIEPIITIAGLARLHKRFGWPQRQLGMQSKTWAFDLVGYSCDLNHEMLVCEVKKSWTEIQMLHKFMEEHGSSPAEALTDMKGAERNAVKKVLGLRQSNAQTLWLLGPSGKSKVFSVNRGLDGQITLEARDERALHYSEQMLNHTLQLTEIAEGKSDN